MSYEGYEQRICANGHYTAVYAYLDHDQHCNCEAPIVWTNQVDETNGPGQGYIDMDKFQITTEQVHPCHACQQPIKTASTTYRVPTHEEATAAREYPEE